MLCLAVKAEAATAFCTANPTHAVCSSGDVDGKNMKRIMGRGASFRQQRHTRPRPSRVSLLACVTQLCNMQFSGLHQTNTMCSRLDASTEAHAFFVAEQASHAWYIYTYAH